VFIQVSRSSSANRLMAVGVLADGKTTSYDVDIEGEM
jgi:hypothetical protein